MRVDKYFDLSKNIGEPSIQGGYRIKINDTFRKFVNIFVLIRGKIE